MGGIKSKADITEEMSKLILGAWRKYRGVERNIAKIGRTIPVVCPKEEPVDPTVTASEKQPSVQCRCPRVRVEQ